MLEAVDGFLHEVDFVLAVGADLCMAGWVFHEDNLVVEERLPWRKAATRSCRRDLSPRRAWMAIRTQTDECRRVDE